MSKYIQCNCCDNWVDTEQITYDNGEAEMTRCKECRKEQIKGIDNIPELLEKLIPKRKLKEWKSKNGYKEYWYIDAENNIRQRLCKADGCGCRYHDNNWNCFNDAGEAQKALELIEAIFGMLGKIV